MKLPELSKLMQENPCQQQKIILYAFFSKINLRLKKNTMMKDYVATMMIYTYKKTMMMHTKNIRRLTKNIYILEEAKQKEEQES